MTTNDNLGNLLAQLIRAPTSVTTDTPAIFRNTVGALISFRIVGSNNTTLFNDDVTVPTVTETRVQIGKGTTPPTRQDFNLENAFPNSPESVLKGVTLPHGYVSGLGKITIATLISPTGGAGSITETALTQFWQNTGSNNERYLLFRDIISPVGFIIGQAINIDYEVFV